MRILFVLKLVVFVLPTLLAWQVSAGPAEDMALAPKISAAVANNDLQKAEELLNDYSNPMLRDIPAPGVLNGFYEAGDLKALVAFQMATVTPCPEIFCCRCLWLRTLKRKTAQPLNNG